LASINPANAWESEKATYDFQYKRHKGVFACHGLFAPFFLSYFLYEGKHEKVAKGGDCCRYRALQKSDVLCYNGFKTSHFC
jgi:hypothetical protein